MRRTPLTRTLLAALRSSCLTLLVCLAGSPIGCGTYRPVNHPLTRWDPTYGYRPTRVQAERPMGDVLLILAFSGGGTRAAALSYGVLQELRDTQIAVDGKPRRLLDEVDLITAVSGGSFTAAYYALRGDRVFVDFEERFLRRNIQRTLILDLLRPKSWFLLASSAFDRSELAIERYDREIVEGATFADIEAARGPLVHINATDLTTGSAFTFVQPQFDQICSDLSSFPVARAVAASSAVPGIFSPIPLRNYAGQCGYQPPRWVAAAIANREASVRRYTIARTAARYADPAFEYLHLLDGGIADNLGLRGPINTVLLTGGLRRRFEYLGAARPRRIAMIVVNAEVHPTPKFARSPASPSMGQVLGAISDVQIYSYNFETLELARDSLERWVRELSPDGAEKPVRLSFVEVAFHQILDPADAAYLNELPTTFALSDEQVDRLIAAGRILLRQSPAFQDLLADLGARSAP
ncbi:patatin-like phospholipase family protein [Candidatus Binatia bacterium]|nr:patatin-like phospholipase family protein [Candidatus Binatia bacterium]